jgi:hypothetical protein
MRMAIRHAIRKLTVILVAFVPLAACSTDKPATAGVAPPTRIPDPPAQPAAAAGESVTVASVPREVRRAVVADAARRFKVTESAVVLSRAEWVTWSDGSLGCPRPGQMYTQMLVSGYRILATTSAGQLEYHTDAQGFATTCDVPAAISGQPVPRRASGR